MKIATKVKLMLRKVLLQCGSIQTDKGELLYDGELEVGTEVFQENAEGEIVPAEDGTYVAENKEIDVKDGKVSEIREKEAEEPKNEPEPEPEPEPDPQPDPQPDPDAPVETEEEPEADPADAPEEQEEQEAIEDRVARLEASIAEIREGIDGLINAIAGLAQRLEVVEEKLKAVEAPGADPADDQPEDTEQNLSRLAIMKKNKNK